MTSFILGAFCGHSLSGPSPPVCRLADAVTVNGPTQRRPCLVRLQLRMEVLFVPAVGLFDVAGLGWRDASELYLVMTFDDAERVAHDGFADRCHGVLRGVMTTTTPPGCSSVSAEER